MKVEIGRYPKGDDKRVVKVKIENFDCWNLDHTLALIIAPALRCMRGAGGGIPGSLIDRPHRETMSWDSPEFRRAERRALKAGEKAWLAALDAMAWSFDQIARDDPDQPPLPDKRTDAALARWRKQMDAYDARIAEGLRLFGEHYRSLWT